MATSDEKKPRLFVRGDCTDNVWLYCGGPEEAEATAGLAIHLAFAVEYLFDAGKKDGAVEQVELRVRHMTDEEVEQIEEV